MQLNTTAPYIAPAAPAPAAQPAPANPEGSVTVNADAATAAREGQKSDSQPQQGQREDRINVSGNDAKESPATTPGQTDPHSLAVEQQLQQLKSRDQEVRTHEQAHARVGGKHAGSPEYEFVRGADGRMYAENGEVSIDTGKVEGDPQATIDKMETVIRAANAPMQPSNQDRRVAAQAAVIMNQAVLELAEMEQEAEVTAEEPASVSQSQPASASNGAGAETTESAPAQAASLNEESDALQTNQQAQSRLEQNMVKRGAFQQAFPPGTVIDDRL